MTKSNKNASFSAIKKFMHRLDTESGAFAFKDPTAKLSTKEKFLSANATILTILIIIFIISTLYVKKLELISVIMCFSYFISVLGFPTQMLKINLNKKVVKDLMEWCESLYDIEKKFESVILQEIARRKMVKLQKYTKMIIEWFKIVGYTDCFFVVIVPTLFIVFLQSNQNFKLPIPIYLPFEDQHNWLCFLVTVTFQLIFGIISAAIGIYIYNYFFCIISHILGYLDIIQEIVETIFKKQIIEKVKEFDEEKPAKIKGTLKIETLMEINDSIEETNKNEIKFDEWMKILCDMITDVNNQIKSLQLLYAEFFLSSEIQSLGALFVTGFVFTVVKQKYIMAVDVGIMCFVFFVICFINELILDKLENIERAFYDIPWYHLSVKDQRMLLIALNCSKTQEGFTAAGIHKLTLERFYIVVKAGYTNFIILKDLVG